MTLRSLHVAAVFFMLTSCGCAAKSNKGKVEGSITLDGQPLAEATIQFLPVDITKGQTAGAVVKNGRYELESSPGEMRVVINSPHVVSQKKAYDDPDSPMVDRTQEQLPERYSTSESELRAIVELGKENNIDFQLSSEGAKPPPSIF